MDTVPKFLPRAQFNSNKARASCLVISHNEPINPSSKCAENSISGENQW
jgi:hypothetical protein